MVSRGEGQWPDHGFILYTMKYYLKVSTLIGISCPNMYKVFANFIVETYILIAFLDSEGSDGKNIM